MTFSPAAYQATASKITAKAGDIDSGISNLSSTVATAGNFFGIDTSELTDWLAETGTEIARFIVEFSVGLWAPVMFYRYAPVWENDVASHLATAQSEIDADAGILKLLDSWTGPAADGYRENLGAQGLAAGILAERCNNAGKVMRDLANLGMLFYGAVLVALATLYLSIMAAIGEAVTIVGIVFIGPTLGVAIGGAITGIAAAGFALFNGLEAAKGEFSKMAQAAVGMPGGRWPDAVA
jgi:hypothetical protein